MRKKLGLGHRTQWIGVGLAVMLSATMATAFASGTRPAGTRATSVATPPKLSWKGTITMWAQTYTPDVPGVT